jgi:phage terminase large subunit-like protein
VGAVDLSWLDDLPADQRAALLLEVESLLGETTLDDYVPYEKQALFHALGATMRERMLSAGNQLGKTLSAGAEVAMHLTGRYPDWWQGKRFTRGNHGLAGSESGELTRKGIQRILFGRDARYNAGTGMIPKDCIQHLSWSRHVNDLIDTARIKFTAPDGTASVSTISLKAYEQGRGKWQADTVDWVWFDEEPPEDIYTEGITRTNVSFGPVIVTCTLLQGMTAIATRFWLELAKYPDAALVNMTIDDVDHYTPEQKAAIIASYPAHEREARTKGIPMLGSGRIFAVEEESIKVEPFAIPSYWPQIAGIDFGFDHPSAAARLAWDRDNDVVYVTACHRASQQTPVLFAAAVKPWGTWLPWAWPHDGLQHDKGSGLALAGQYRDQGLNMLPDKATHPPADGEEEGTGGNGVEAGLLEMLDRMQTGRLKVFSNLHDWFEEFRMYHRKDGKIVKVKDDLISATRYGHMMLRHAIVKPKPTTSGMPRVNHGARRGGY